MNSSLTSGREVLRRLYAEFYCGYTVAYGCVADVKMQVLSQKSSVASCVACCCSAGGRSPIYSDIPVHVGGYSFSMLNHLFILFVPTTLDA